MMGRSGLLWRMAHELTGGRCGRFTLLLALIGVAACAYNPAPVVSLPPPPTERIKHHTVAPGDTLFAIAWRYEKDLEVLAQANGLSPPYRILVGQRLTLDTSGAPSGSSSAMNRQDAVVVGRVPQAGSFQVGSQDAVGGASAQGRTQDVVQGDVQGTVPGATAGAPRQADSGRPAVDGKATSGTTAGPPTAPAVIAAPHKLPAGEVVWRWPAKGAVSHQYDTGKVFKGINIQSSPGQKVVAAAAGVVVYAGSGLRGYGNLVIIKHSDIYLSAYAHNKTLLVADGASVQAGADISVVGGDPDNRGRLYFEIRKSGKPIDPLRLLPRQ